MRFRDLEPCTYSSGSACHDASWSCPLRAIGWLEFPFVLYTRGRVSPGVLDRLSELRDRCRLFSNATFRGWHTCSLCRRSSDALEDSSCNLFVPGDGAVFIAPGRVDHYVQKHHYRPPTPFLDALDRCPDPWSPEYLDALRIAHGGAPLPLADRDAPPPSVA